MEPVNTASNPYKNQMIIMLFVFFIILVFAAILIFSSGILTKKITKPLSNTLPPTPVVIPTVIQLRSKPLNWKTFTDNTDGFAFAYPISVVGPLEQSNALYFSENQIGSGSGIFNFTVAFGTIITNNDPLITTLGPELFSNTQTSIRVGNETITKVATLTISGYPAVQFVDNNNPQAVPPQTSSNGYMINNNGTYYLIFSNYYNPSDDRSKQNVFLEQIAKSFTIINHSSSSHNLPNVPAQQTWKVNTSQLPQTYTNKTIPFSISYPSGWSIFEQTNSTGKQFALLLKNANEVQSNIDIVWGEGLNSSQQCNAHPGIQLKNSVVQGCSFQGGNGHDSLEFTVNVSPTTSVDVTTSSTQITNDQTILQLLNTLSIGN